MKTLNIMQILNSIKYDYNIAKKTWFGSGGKTKIFFEPRNIAELIFFLKFLPKRIIIFVIGLGSNTLIRDGGFNGVIIKLNKGFNKIDYNKKKKIITVGSGVKNIDLSKFSLDNQIRGFEFLIGIPGSLGGSIKMNASCYEQTISDLFIQASLIDRKGNIHSLTKEKIQFEYRKTSIPKDWIFLDATFRVKNSKKELIKKRMDSITTKRKKSQPVACRTGGSTFQNSKEYKAWELIDKIGYRGMNIGDAKISDLHPNFIINKGNAKSLDIELLGEEIRKKVFSRTGIKLKWEIIRVGEFVKI